MTDYLKEIKENDYEGSDYLMMKFKSDLKTYYL